MGKLAKPTGQPWITRSIVRLIRKRRRLYRKCRVYPSIAHLDELEVATKKIKWLVADAKSDYINNHLSKQMEEGNSKPFFNYLNKHSGRSNNIMNLANCESDDIPKSLAEHFSSVFEDQGLPLPIFADNPTCPKQDEIKISRQGIYTLLSKLDQRKASGPDNLPTIALKNFAINCPSFVDCVHSILKTSLIEGKMPDVWKRATIRPIYKGGCRSDAHDYRPISLTSIIAKTLEHVICSSMWQHINDYGLLKDNQHGFCKSLNTTTQLLHVVHKAAEDYDQKKEHHMISFDFSKAFDRVPHNLLIYKLKSYNFDKRCINWIEEWLHRRSSVVSVNGLLSEEFHVRSGVPQGSVLGPLLFILYVNDMSEDIKNSDCRLYADDTILSSASDPSLIQDDINKLYFFSCQLLLHNQMAATVQIGLYFYLRNA